jgi:hypothetical protein
MELPVEICWALMNQRTGSHRSIRFSDHQVKSDLADPLLRLLNVSIRFSLYTSFDYLGFWLYAVFGLLVAGALYGENMSAKITAVTVGVFGFVYHGLLAALLLVPSHRRTLSPGS